MRILLIDDDDLVRDTLRAVLVDAGYKVTGATDGVEGLKLFHAEQFDLVITDILMPQKEGVETIIEMRRHNPDLRIVAMSGGGRTNNLHPLKIARRAGADVALAKPFEPNELLKIVETIAQAEPGRCAMPEEATP